MEQSHKKLIVQPQTTVVENNEAEIDLMELFYHLLDHWKMIVAFFLVGAIAMGCYTHFMAVPQYQATTKMYVLSSSDSVVNLSDLQIGNYLASDFQEVFATHEVTESVIKRLGLPYTYKKMQDMLSVSNPSGTRILHIKVTSPDPEEAALIANEYFEVASQYVADVMVTDKPTMLSSAQVPKNPVSPSMTKNVMMGAMLGFILACGYLVVKFLLDDKVKSADDITKLTGLPVLAEVPVFSLKNNDK